jgi:hypothetical protein
MFEIAFFSGFHEEVCAVVGQQTVSRRTQLWDALIAGTVCTVKLEMAKFFTLFALVSE